MGIHKLPKLRDYWSVNEGLGNNLIQTTMTRDWFLEILQNLHFADNLQKLPPKESESFDRAWKHRPFFNHLVKHFQEAVLPELHQSIDEHMCKFKGKSLMHQYMKNKPIKWGLKFWLRCSSTSEYLYQFDMYLGKKVQNRVWSWWISCSLPLRESKIRLLWRVFWQLSYKSKSHVKAIWGWNLRNWNR